MDLTLNWGAISTRPQKHVLGQKDVIWRTILTVKIGPTVRPVDEMNQQTRHGKKPTVAHWLFAQTTHVVTAPYWFALCGHTLERVAYFKFHRSPFMVFGATGVDIRPFPLTWLLVYTTIVRTTAGPLYKSRSSPLSDDSIICKETLTLSFPHFSDCSKNEFTKAFRAILV